MTQKEIVFGILTRRDGSTTPIYYINEAEFGMPISVFIYDHKGNIEAVDCEGANELVKGWRTKRNVQLEEKNGANDTRA
jgi:hypothetical protein